jgi:Leucine Rich repeat
VSVVNSQIISKFPKIIDTTIKKPSINQLPPRFHKEFLSFISPHETAATIHLVQSKWKNILFKDGSLDLSGLTISDDDLKQIIEKYQKMGKGITSIKLAHCSAITDEGLEHFAHLPLKKLDLSNCNITDKGLKHLAHLYLKQLNLSYCFYITDKGLEHLSRLPLIELDLSYCDRISDEGFEHLAHVYLKIKDLVKKRLVAEKNALEQFVAEKSKKFAINCICQFKFNVKEMGYDGVGIFVNSLFKLGEKNIDAFLLENPNRKESIKAFLVQKKPELLEKVSCELLEWFEEKGSEYISQTEGNKFLAKEILIMHAIGKLSTMKRFELTHELGHALEEAGIKSISDFDALELDFIKPHQYSELRADLTAAREENAHEVGISLFEWRSIIAPQPPEHDEHPTDENRAKALRIDSAKQLSSSVK